jgi:hypothetical protein
MTDARDEGRAQGDPGEANRGIGQERVGESSPGPRQRPLDPAAGGPGSGAGETRVVDPDDGAPRTEEDRAIRDQGLPQNG